MKKTLALISSLSIVFLIPSWSFAQTANCPSISAEELMGSAKTYVKIEAGGSQNNLLKEESVGPFDLQAQRKRVSECGSGAAKCFKQFPDTMKDGEMLISYKFKDGPQGIPQAQNLNISSVEFKNKDLLSCLKTYWSEFIIPNAGASKGHSGSATVSVAIKKIGPTP